MATAPVKPQPLHNFPLSLKWGQTSTAATTAITSNPTTTTANHHRPSESETESDHEPPARRVGSRSSRNRRDHTNNSVFNFASCSSLLSVKNKSPPSTPPHKPSPAKEEAAEEVDEEEGNLKRWKLRPRKGNGHYVAAVGGGGGGELKEANEAPKSLRLRGMAAENNGGGSNGSGAVEKTEKRKFWITLAREEIEEDIFILTGSRPARRPRKRPKNVQKVLDNGFPGLWLVGATADSYRIAYAPVKR